MNLFGYNITISKTKPNLNLELIPFFTKYYPDFNESLYNKECLNLSNDNNVHISNNRCMGTSTSLILTLIYKALFSKNLQIYTSFITYNHFDVIKHIINIIEKSSNTIFIAKSTKSSIELSNGNRIQILPNIDHFLRGISSDVLFVLDEVTIAKINPKLNSSIDMSKSCGINIAMIKSN